jgi:hypothetical protein
MKQLKVNDTIFYIIIIILLNCITLYCITLYYFTSDWRQLLRCVREMNHVETKILCSVVYKLLGVLL